MLGWGRRHGAARRAVSSRAVDEGACQLGGGRARAQQGHWRLVGDPVRREGGRAARRGSLCVRLCARCAEPGRGGSSTAAGPEDSAAHSVCVGPCSPVAQSLDGVAGKNKAAAGGGRKRSAPKPKRKVSDGSTKVITEITLANGTKMQVRGGTHQWGSTATARFGMSWSWSWSVLALAGVGLPAHRVRAVDAPASLRPSWPTPRRSWTSPSPTTALPRRTWVRLLSSSLVHSR